MLREMKRFTTAFGAGVLGGGLAVAVVVVPVLVAGWPGSSTKTTTVVQQAAVLPSDVSTQARGLTARQIYERVASGVVFVSAAGVGAPNSSSEPFTGGEPSTSTGSGIEIGGDGTILTNWHVVQGASKITVGLGRGSSVTARLIGKDPSEDLALLRMPIAGVVLHPLTLGNSSTVHVGDPVLAIGNPFGLERTLTTGVISALQRQIQAPDGATISNVLQTDAPIDPGSSGGPLLNDQGEVIGINSEIETSGSGGGYSGIAFAIPIDTAKGKLAMLKKGEG